MRIDFQLTYDPPHARLQIAGALDFSATEQLCDLFSDLAHRGCTRIELDLAGATCLDVVAERVLQQERRRLGRSGGSLVVVAMSAACLLVGDPVPAFGSPWFPTERSGHGPRRAACTNPEPPPGSRTPGAAREPVSAPDSPARR
ncbi:MAG: STAS domain-containing protein [Nocardioidaceae bacterium]|nr:STAS domain-containing protein [Nocardioidaceae bacterium]NUS52639.1 STAS domain-containing protein [Nocardioidaceae bacterium]